MEIIALDGEVSPHTGGASVKPVSEDAFAQGADQPPEGSAEDSELDNLVSAARLQAEQQAQRLRKLAAVATCGDLPDPETMHQLEINRRPFHGHMAAPQPKMNMRAKAQAKSNRFMKEERGRPHGGARSDLISEIMKRLAYRDESPPHPLRHRLHECKVRMQNQVTESTMSSDSLPHASFADVGGDLEASPAAAATCGNLPNRDTWKALGLSRKRFGIRSAAPYSWISEDTQSESDSESECEEEEEAGAAIDDDMLFELGMEEGGEENDEALEQVD